MRKSDSTAYPRSTRAFCTAPALVGKSDVGIAGVTVRRERRWTSADTTPDYELVLDPMPTEAAAEATKLCLLFLRLLCDEANDMTLLARSPIRFVPHILIVDYLQIGETAQQFAGLVIRSVFPRISLDH